MKILSSLPAAVAALLLLASCDSIPEDERFVPADSSFEPARTVLVEEYTGQTCVNCPGAHILMGDLEAKFNSREHVGIISVGIHIPMFGQAAPKGMVAVEADTYSQGVESAPSARINRRTDPLTTDRWTGSILQELVRKSPIVFTGLTADLTPDGQLSVDGKVHSSENLKDTKLQLWLVEDDIKMPQLKPEGPVADYRHHSVFRAAINGVNGQNIELKEKKETPFHVSGFPVADYVNTDNLRVVAFVYNDADGVLNARQCGVVKVSGGIQIVGPQ